MKTLLEVCKGVYEIRRKEWARNYDFTDQQVLELYGETVTAAAKVMDYKLKPMSKTLPHIPRPPKETSVQEEVVDDVMEDLW